MLTYNLKKVNLIIFVNITDYILLLYLKSIAIFTILLFIYLLLS